MLHIIRSKQELQWAVLNGLLPTYSNNDALKRLTDLYPNVGYKHSRGIVEVVYAFDTSLLCCWPMRRDKQAATHSCCAETAKLQTSQDRHEGVTYWDPLDTKLLITHQQREFNSTSWKQTKAVYSVARSFTVTRNQSSENKVTAHNNNHQVCDFL